MAAPPRLFGGEHQVVEMALRTVGDDVQQPIRSAPDVAHSTKFAFEQPLLTNDLVPFKI